MKRQVIWALAMVLVMSAVGICVSLAAGRSEEKANADNALPALVYSAEVDIRQFDIKSIVDGEKHRLTSDQLSHSPDWSPDGRRIAFVKGQPGSWSLTGGYLAEAVWVMDANGENARQVTPDGIDPYGGPKWTPDGQGLLFVLDVRGVSEMSPTGWDLRLVRLNLATSALTTLSPHYPSRWFSVSPYGQHVVGIAQKGESYRNDELFRMDLGTQTITPLPGAGYATFYATENFQPLWSPDGESVAVRGDSALAKRQGMWVYKMQGQTWVPVGQSNSPVSFADAYTWLSPDELLLSRDCQLFRVTVGASESTQEVNPAFPFCVNSDVDAAVR